ncbi:hypothetical protein CDAR_103261 [Caerostris darwini]|uniref:Uncharacterized protein n=1 Tax=Caerostris darwini TaxID=1538125 RepID=A0AAV4V369_9ARAC|nr:hypothetical protein CDAR_103261 [Caerostris darwini]
MRALCYEFCLLLQQSFFSDTDIQPDVWLWDDVPFQIAIPSLPTAQTLLWDQNKTARAAFAVSCPPCGQSQQGVSLNPVRHRAAVCVIECPQRVLY